jgi:hypothetical protein
MYWKWLRNVVTFFDILAITLSIFLIIIPLTYGVLEIFPDELDVINFFEVLAKSMVSISSIWVAVSVIVLVWVRHRDGLRIRLEYCNEAINKPLLVDLFMDEVKEYLEHSILHSVVNGYSTVHQDDAFLIDIKDENELKEKIEWRSSLSNRLEDLNLFVSRLLRNSDLYPRSLKKRLQTLPNQLSHYNHEFALLVYQIFQRARSLGVKGNKEIMEREALTRVEKIVLSKVGFRDSGHIDHFIEELYEKQIQALIDFVKDEACKLRSIKEELSLNLDYIKRELEEYMEEMQMRYPQEYLRKRIGRYSIVVET